MPIPRKTGGCCLAPRRKTIEGHLGRLGASSPLGISLVDKSVCCISRLLVKRNRGGSD